MRKNILFCTLLLLLFATGLRAQDGYTDRAKKYIDTYAPLAIEEQRRSGIPAAVTLGQGILETEAGASELMTKANNHFGIKCKSDWQGDKFLHTDDAPNECFKMYKCAKDSYKDHSDYLKRNQRYSQLFSLKQTDYKAWAVCLRRCGYATNPQYAQNLIKIIETFNLQTYTYTALDSSLLNNQLAATAEEAAVAEVGTIESTADSAREYVSHTINDAPAPEPESAPAFSDDGKVTLVNGLRAVSARKGEMLLPYAVKYKIRYAHLLELNDLADGPLPFNSCIYLEKKKTLGAHATHIVQAGENLVMISQAEGIQLKRLMAMNMLNPNEEPVTGTTLYLQSASAVKPKVIVGATVAHQGNAIVSDGDMVKQDNDYVATGKVTSPAAPVVTEAAAPVVVPPVNQAVSEVVTAPKPDPGNVAVPAPASPVQKHVIIVKTPAEDAPAQMAPVQAAVSAQAVAEEKPAEATTEEEFTKLKADLDKVVYADDSKLVPKTNTPQPVQQKVAEDKGTKEEKYYTVKKGDTAFSIAKRNNISVDDLLKWNDMTASGVKVGKNLRVK